jgi:hypothetical protein
LKNISILLIAVFALFFSACSSKSVYEPKVVKDSWDYHGSADESIVDVTSDVALLEDGRVRTKDGVIDVKIPEEYRLIGASDGWIISANFDGNMSLQYKDDQSMNETFSLEKTIAAASIKNDILAVLFSDNEMALYSVSTKALLLKEQGNAPVIVDSRIVNPYFMDDLVMFLTLDGKLVIVNSKLKKKLRTVIVSSEENFNNIIYFNVIDNKLIAATSNKILSMSNKEIRANYEIRNATYNGENIFITTKQGEVISLTPDLQVNAKLKFPFAHFLGIIANGDNIYILEKEGYIIKVDKDLLKYEVYDVNVEEGYVYIAGKKFFVDDEFISVEQ